MKIGILTLPLHGNYGGNLQAYALMKVLRGLGHEPCLIVRRAKPFPAKRIPLELVKRIVKKLVLRRAGTSIGEGIFHSRLRKLTEKNAREFIDGHIQPQTREFSSFKDISRNISTYSFGALIVGSDQIWRPKYTPSIEESFFSFLASSESTKRIAYAPSFGTDEWEYTQEETKRCAGLLQRFDSISVREISGVRLCKDKLGRESTHVLDPTMLLDVNDYLDLSQNVPTSPASKKNLLVYVLDLTDEKRAVMDHLARNLELNPIHANRLDANGSSIPVEEWVAGFRDSAFVLTDSFHACVFSILFNKPFIAYGNARRGLARFESLLSIFGLKSRLISEPSQATPELINSTINWQEVNCKVAERRAASMHFLSDSLRDTRVENND